MAEELNDQERRELERWRSGSLRKSWPVVESVPDGLRYAAELARAQGTEGGDEHDELLRQAAIRLRDMNDTARVVLGDRDLLLWLHAEAAWWLQLDRDEHESAEILHMWSKRVAYLEARVGELHNKIGELRASIADIDAHATPVGLLHNDDPEGSPHHYLLTVGALHRALGKAYTAEPCESERTRLRSELDRLHSWAGLMELLDEHWPASIFVGDGSNETADPGARIVALIREVGRLRREVMFEANGADTFSGADARAERGQLGAPFIAEDFGLDIDTEAGGIYISLNHRPVARTEAWGADVNVDYDADGIPTGVEILRSPAPRPQCAVHPEAGGE